MSGDFMRKLKGNLYLGYRAVIAHPLKRFLNEDLRTGKERFLANYAPEGCLPTTALDREVLRGASRCIHCGLCEAHDLALAALPRTVYVGASQLAVSYTRAVPDIPRVREAVSKITEEQLARGEAVCPTGVPLRALLGYLRRKLSELEPYQSKADRAP